jgi:hypothetical protein
VTEVEIGLCDGCGTMERMIVVECNGDPLHFCYRCMRWLRTRLHEFKEAEGDTAKQR